MTSLFVPAHALVAFHRAAGLDALLSHWKRVSALPSAVLLTGPSGIGKTEVAFFIAQALLCETAGFHASASASQSSFSACGECTSCMKMLGGHHPNFTQILPDEDSDLLKIDAFRNLKSMLGFSGYEGYSQVIWIPQLERMTLAAAQSILKILEEPPAHWVFLMTTRDLSLILPTLLSRCQKVRLKPLPKVQLQEWLVQTGVVPQKAVLCAQWAQGSWTRAMTFAQDDVWSHRKAVCELLTSPATVLPELIDWSLEKPAHLGILLDLLEQLYADLIRWSLAALSPSAYPWSFADSVDCFVKGLATDQVTQRENKNSPGAEKSVERAIAEKIRLFSFRQFERLLEIRASLHAPMNRKLLVQSLLLPWLQVEKV